MQRRTVLSLAAAVPAAALVAPGAAHAHGGRTVTTIDLPAGWQPEGIAIGDRPYAYFGSRVSGSIYRASLRTGEGEVFSEGPGTPSLGLKLDDRNRLFVAGGTGGDARVIDARSGRVLKSYRLAAAGAFVNDVVLTGDGAWFTDSYNPVLYRLTLGRRGELPASATSLPLTGITFTPGGVNANGITLTPDRRALLVVHSPTGVLYRVDPRTGAAVAVDLGGETLVNGDGLLLEGRTLYAVQNRRNEVAVVRVSRDGTSGRVVTRVTDPSFDVPATVASYGDRLWFPNARFTTPPTPETTYTAVSIRKP
ncbi:SMP-30/gluconolactonase/LRE family protein [Catenuloplanes atrovinosus]|uniref:Sugar lactone lactonase YvrE n=1 Tax=Catenuloplanes atrovinosus TaxID=137266 RepID=A0AAE4CBV1_9ACTN|nr:superoxide dismutase [Catenuloplanes atrovinosus]MDR7278457.1 sugar lactone lactonase YvrE [Catenuloplanes atrovinosus]